MELTARLDQLKEAELAPVVRKVLGDDQAWPLSWNFEALDWKAVNPATAGLFTVTGTAQTSANRELPWIAVLKVVADIDLTGSPLDNDYIHQPQDWNYWKREALAFRSGLLSGWPGPLVPVRCYHVEEMSEGQAWIWLQARDGAGPHASWTIQPPGSAAYDLGALGAQWQSRLLSVEHYPWLARRWLRGWVRSIRTYAVDHFIEHECGSGSPLESLLLKTTRQRIADLISDADDLLAAFESLPHTLAHQDPQLSNLFAATPDEFPAQTVAIDWGMVGIAPIGADLGLHIEENISSWSIDQRRAADHDRASTAAYLKGLGDFGWDGDTDSVKFARAVAAALNGGTWLASEVAALCPDIADRFDPDEAAWPAKVAAKQGISTAAALERWAAGLGYLLDLADEARQLQSQLQL